MKNKSKIIKTLILSVVAMAFIFIFIYIANNILDSFLGDWIIDKFTVKSYHYYPEGKAGYEYNIDKEKLKLVIRNIIIIFILSIFIIAYVVSLITSNIAKKRNITYISSILENHLNENEYNSNGLGKEYVELSNAIYKINNEKLKNEQIIKEENIKKNELISYLAHDLKTPLTVIIGYLDILKQFDDMTQLHKNKCIDSALAEANRLESLINEFFEITRYNLNSIKLEKTNTDIEYMLTQMSDEFYPLLIEKNLVIELDLADGIFINIDVEKMARVFSNLIKNAINYSYIGTKIVISSKLVDGKYTVKISSKGDNISENDIERIFDKFYRVEQSRNSSTGGAGLGLSIAKEIILLHNGSIEVESKDNINSFIVNIPV